MDYRKRKYYLVRLDYLSYTMRMKFLKLIDSVKIHSPYNHFRIYSSGGNNYDGNYQDITGMGYIQFMLSCQKEDSSLVEFELRKAERRDECGCTFVELTKEMCGQ